MRVLLISMPMGALERQALGISILKPLLQSRGVRCDVRYLTFPFADTIGCEVYQWMSYQLPYTAFAGDWCFTAALYGANAAPAGFEQAILRDRFQMSDESVERIRSVRDQVPRFLDYAMAAVPWQDYDVVGFTSTFEQNIASLAMAKRVRAAFPKVRIVFGGANWEEEMGLELHRHFPFVDFVCSGESEHSLPLLLDAISKRGNPERRLAAVPGIVYRSKNGESVLTGKSSNVTNLDELPNPDFSDYFDALRGSSSGNNVLPSLLFETSRGCWWGAKSHCTFCGLNGNSMSFRSKTSVRALAELRGQLARWQVQTVEAVDNILDMSYFDGFLPALADAQLGVELFYEVKANLSRRHLKSLHAANVKRIQPGIESMSDHVLQLMRKGTTGLRNIQLLKWCAEYEIKAEWNLLYGFPGETTADYEEILRLLPAIRHLNPPSACGPLRLDRFSPFHRTPQELGVRNLRPLSTMSYLYPFPVESLERISYYFDFDHVDGRDPMAFAKPVVDYCNEWRAIEDSGSLNAALMPDGALGLLDTRGGGRSAIRLEGWKREVYMQCDSLQPVPALLRRVPEVAEVELRRFLAQMCAQNMMATDGKNYVATAIARGVLRKRLEEQEERRIHPGLAGGAGAGAAGTAAAVAVAAAGGANLVHIAAPRAEA